MSSYGKFALTIMGRYVDLVLPSFKHLKQDIDGAGLHLNLREYAAIGIFTPIAVFVSGMLLFSLILGALISSTALAFFLALLVSLIFASATFGIIFLYPSFVSSDRKKKIETVMPFATTYMATIAGSGAPPATVFRLMAEFSEYGEFSKEIQRIIRDIDVFGYDLPTAIKRTAIKTPSEQMRELMWGILSTSLSGANLAEYLRSKSITFLNEYRRRLQDYAKQLSLFVEIYLTLIIVGSIFFMVLTTIISAISASGSIVMLQFLIVFAFLPVISVGFIYLLKGASPLAK